MSWRDLVRDGLRATGTLGLAFRGLEVALAMRHPPPPKLAPDGKPLPDRLRMMRIGGTADWRFFYEGGEQAARAIVDIAERAGAYPNTWRRVLDWGCGCGRIARHFMRLTPAEIVGRDVDAFTVKWCAQHLPGDFAASKLAPPLDLPSRSIDFAYGYSVLTHLSAASQRAWMTELARVLNPGALAILTFHDLDHAEARTKKRAAADGVMLSETVLEGSNFVAAFQTIEALTAVAPSFELVRHIPSRHSPFDQAVAVLRLRDRPVEESQ